CDVGVVLIGAAGALLAVPPPAPVRPSGTAPSAPNSPDALAADFAHLQSGLHAKVGLVVRAVGTEPKTQVVLGSSDFADQPAWSTIKVPLVMAAMRQRSID